MTTFAAVAQIVAAVGTVILAWFTWRLAVATRRMANETREENVAVREQLVVANRQLALSETTYRANMMPWLTKPSPEQIREAHFFSETGAWVSEDGSSRINFAIMVANRGNGLCVIKEGGIRIISSERCPKGEVVGNARAISSTIGVAEATGFSLELQRTTGKWVDLTIDEFTGRFDRQCTGRFYVEVKYTDAAASQEWLARFGLLESVDPSRPQRIRWAVGRIEYFHAGEPTPFVVTEMTPW
jgi:hypothetical protein